MGENPSLCSSITTKMQARELPLESRGNPRARTHKCPPGGHNLRTPPQGTAGTGRGVKIQSYMSWAEGTILRHNVFTYAQCAIRGSFPPPASPFACSRAIYPTG